MKRIIYDYENPHIVGRANKSFPLAKVIVAIIVVALLVALVYILFFRKTSYYVENKGYFSVVSGEFDSESEAIRAAAEIKSRGGGGYVVKESKYEVIVAVYDSKKSADAVAERYDYTVKDLGEYSLEINFADPSLCKEAAEIYAFPQQIIDTLFSESISLDTGELSSVAVLHSLDKLGESVDINYDRLTKIKNKYSSDNSLKQCTTMYEKIKSALSNVKEGEYTISVSLKYCLTELTYIYKNFLSGNILA